MVKVKQMVCIAFIGGARDTDGAGVVGGAGDAGDKGDSGG
jgi:hypothetical protein